ncbi:MAG: methionine gamma-lyase family protein [Clostridia bacterium]|nr:methionine gamma-lyase family protein [Clostridia bacterium]
MVNSIQQLIEETEASVSEQFCRIDRIALHCSRRVLGAFQSQGVGARHFAPTEGYGYDDIGRDTLDRVFADSLQVEDALVRPQIANGTHAIFLALCGVLEAGDTILSVTDMPYDTLQTAIGCNGDLPNSLKRMGVSLLTIPFQDGKIDLPAVLDRLQADASIRMVYVQRSRGYAWRNSVSIAEMEACFKTVRSVRKDVIIFVDNCYGEFVEENEPTAVGADLMAGSLIKNCGGGIAPTGGYIAGNRDLIEQISFRQTTPGSGREVGSYAASYRPFYQGLFLAPHTVAQCMKSAVLFAALFERLGYESMPSPKALRSDIIQSVRFDTKDELIAFCRAVQSAAPIDSYVVPEPWEMPGYADPVIMAAGAFVQGATTELSADAPIREPYIGYMQGALTYEHARLAAEKIIAALWDGRGV